MTKTVSPEDIIALVGTADLPQLVDCRREPAFRASHVRLPTAVWRSHLAVDDWIGAIDPARPVVAYCAHGHNVSEITAAELHGRGCDAAILAGGMEAYLDAGGPVVRHLDVIEPTLAAPSVWVTRARPKVDRIACPWLLRRFVDRKAVIHYVAAEWVVDIATEIAGVPFDVAGVRFSHRGETCSFDTMLAEFGLEEPALLHLARIVRGADTARLDLEPEAAGLLAILLGLSASEPDDLRQLVRGLPVMDFLYAWCRHATAERHNWPVGAAA